MDTRIRRYDNVTAFCDVAASWLLRAEAEHNLILGLLVNLHRGVLNVTVPPYMAVVEIDGAVAGCALRTPPHKLIVTRMPAEAIPALVADVHACFGTLPAVLGPTATAQEVGRCWAERHGCIARPGMRQRLYLLRRLRPPGRPARGFLRQANLEDLPLVAEWIDAFAAESHVPVDAQRHAAARVAAGDLALWCSDGRAVSMAGVSGRSRNGVRIGYVYTPPAHRGRGYATSCVAALTQRELDVGAAFCCLFTDLSNHTSNWIYQQIGYEPECDFTDILLD